MNDAKTTLEWANAILAEYEVPDGVRLTAVTGEPFFAMRVKLQRPFTGRTMSYTQAVLDDPVGREAVEKRLRRAIVEFLTESWTGADARWLATRTDNPPASTG